MTRRPDRRHPVSILCSFSLGLLPAQCGRKRPSATRLAFGGQRETQIVLADVDQVGQSVDKTKHD
ncbi:hypothetical protein [Rhizobium yanglingense]